MAGLLKRFGMGWTLAAILMLLGSPSHAQSRATGPHSVVMLLATREAAAAGGQLLVGLRFQMEPGWHIYWVNPGDSGEPPKVEWRAPAGFHIGTIEWPTPKKLAAFSVVDYGYENDALLIARVSVPANVNSGQNERIAAKVNWLVCREVCIPARAQLSLNLPASTWRSKGGYGESGQQRALFREALTKIPSRVPASWEISVIAEKDDFVLTIQTGKSERSANFFPLEAEQIKNAAPQAATPFSKGVRLRLQKSDGLLRPIARLRGVIELGAGRAYVIAAPVHAAAKGNRR